MFEFFDRRSHESNKQKHIKVYISVLEVLGLQFNCKDTSEGAIISYWPSQSYTVYVIYRAMS